MTHLAHLSPRYLLAFFLLFNSVTSVSIAAPQVVSALGFIEPKEGLVDISTTQSAVITELKVQEGEQVKKGQILAVLDNHALLEASVKQAQAKVDLFKAKLAKVKAGASQAEIKAQKAVIQRLQSQLTTSNSRCNSAKILQQKQAISKNEFEDKCLSKKELQAQLREAQATLVSIKEVRKVDVDVAKAELSQAQASVVKAEAELERSIIRAPIDATVLKIYVKNGELISSDGILQLGQTQTMSVKAEVYETDISHVKLGQSVEISSPSFSRKLQGEVVEIGLLIGKNKIFDEKPAFNTEARVVEVKIKLNSEDSAIVTQLSNLQVTVSINTKQPPN